MEHDYVRNNSIKQSLYHLTMLTKLTLEIISFSESSDDITRIPFINTNLKGKSIIPVSDLIKEISPSKIDFYNLESNDLQEQSYKSEHLKRN